MLSFWPAWFVWVSEVPLLYIFFSGISEPKYSVRWQLLYGVFLASIGNLVNYISQNNSIINGALSLIMYMTFGLFFYRVSLGKAVFLSGIFNLLSVATEILVQTIGAGFFSLAIDALNHSSYVLIAQVSITRSIQTILYLAVSSFLRSKNIQSRTPLHLIAFPLIIFACICGFYYLGKGELLSDRAFHILSIVDVLLSVVSIVIILYQMEYLQNLQEFQYLKAENTRLQTEKTYYDILEDQNQSLMIYAHDAKKHLAAIQSLNTDPQISSYVDALSNQLKSYAKNGHSGNKLLDVMLEKYAISCRKKGVLFQYDVKLCNLSILQDMDLVAILGNLMDNAVEAAEQSSAKTIQLSTAKRNSYAVLIVSNSCDNAPSVHGSGLLSTKIEKFTHGYGIRSIKRTLQKYDGDFDWEYDEESHQFTATAMIVNTSIQ